MHNRRITVCPANERSSRNPGVASAEAKASSEARDNSPDHGLGEDFGHSRAKGEERAAEVGNKTSKADFVVEVKGCSNTAVGESRNTEKAEIVCRICHFGSEPSKELIPIGCDCRGELGGSHRHCAEAWFLLKGNRLCEICGQTAKNININAMITEEDSSTFMNPRRMEAATLHASPDGLYTAKPSLCNFLLGCLAVAIVLTMLALRIYMSR